MLTIRKEDVPEYLHETKIYQKKFIEENNNEINPKINVPIPKDPIFLKPYDYENTFLTEEICKDDIDFDKFSEIVDCLGFWQAETIPYTFHLQIINLFVCLRRKSNNNPKTCHILERIIEISNNKPKSNIFSRSTLSVLLTNAYEYRKINYGTSNCIQTLFYNLFNDIIKYNSYDKFKKCFYDYYQYCSILNDISVSPTCILSSGIFCSLASVPNVNMKIVNFLVDFAFAGDDIDGSDEVLNERRKNSAFYYFNQRTVESALTNGNYDFYKIMINCGRIDRNCYSVRMGIYNPLIINGNFEQLEKEVERFSYTFLTCNLISGCEKLTLDQFKYLFRNWDGNQRTNFQNSGGVSYHNTIFKNCVKFNRLDILEFMFKEDLHKCKINTYDYSTRKYVFKRYEINYDWSMLAEQFAKAGNLEGIKFAIEHESPINSNCEKTQDLECLKFIIQTQGRFRLSYNPCKEVNSFKYLNVKLYVDLMDPHTKNIELIKYRLEVEPSYIKNPAVLYSAVYFNNIECMKYLHKKGCPISDIAVNFSAVLGHYECLVYLLDNYNYKKKLYNDDYNMVNLVMDGSSEHIDISAYTSRTIDKEKVENYYKCLELAKKHTYFKEDIY